jgi:bifunctional non-homologous end joining protein LigD
VIVDFTAPRGNREYFGSVVLGVYDGGQARLCRPWWRRILPGHAQDASRKHDEIEKPTTSRSRELRTSASQVKFTEWTDSGEMRCPVSLGLRTDRPARQVRREQA